MSEPAPSPPDVVDPDRPRSPLMILFRPMVLIPVTLVLLAVLAPIIYRSTRFTGIPNIEEIVARDDVRVIIDDENNAFSFYKSAVSMLPPTDVDVSVGMLAVREGRSWEVVPESVREYLATTDEAMAEWRLGTELDQGVYVDVASADFTALIPVTQEMRQFGRLAVLRALQNLDEGNTEEAWQWLRAMMRSSRNTGQHGFIVERLVGVALHRMAADSLAVWAAHENVTEKDLQKALAELREIDKLTGSNSAALKAEYTSGINSISRPKSLDGLVNYDSSVPKGVTGAYLFVNGEPQLSRLLYRHVFANYLSQCDLPRNERTHSGSRLDLYTPTGKESPKLMDPGDLDAAVMRSILARLMIPAVANCVTAFDLERARQDALELALQVEIYRRRHGEYPSKLDDLVPELISEVPRDVMGSDPSEQMMMLKRDFHSQADAEGKPLAEQELPAEGLIIYSRGREAGDDGGAIEGSRDVGIRIPLPDSRPATTTEIEEPVIEEEDE